MADYFSAVLALYAATVQWTIHIVNVDVTLECNQIYFVKMNLLVMSKQLMTKTSNVIAAAV
jgi:hypothetical protein